MQNKRSEYIIVRKNFALRAISSLQCPLTIWFLGEVAGEPIFVTISSVTNLISNRSMVDQNVGVSAS